MPLNESPLDAALATIKQLNDRLSEMAHRVEAAENQPKHQQPSYSSDRLLMTRVLQLLESLDRGVNEDKETGAYEEDELIAEFRRKVRS